MCMDSFQVFQLKVKPIHIHMHMQSLLRPLHHVTIP